ncbi:MULTISPECIES: DUF2239 family protein [unclassified Dyella]|uniref:DUF2239 family protein n=1 Tax=unclassified Dyella TaxID=2634549 RepID=UPI000C814D19|nr:MULTISPECIES: DUF2239 family protein [unclassified Dyella]MDR3443642.1 DUF2239 family protein [Dyella sp.]PMQ02622.1 hypothetical protein DyAD56_23480 [Dyella sp. AD56]
MNQPHMAQHNERNVRLLPRHWAWLEAQPRGVHASLRLLVEMASRDMDGHFRAVRIKEECYLYMRDMAGDRPHFEEAVRAMFANDTDGLQQQMTSWPTPVRTHITALLAATQVNVIGKERM